MIKPKARILDATAGNRFIWKTKESPFVVWIDIEPELEYPPDRFLDCTKTDFPNKYFNAIFFDPPHDFGVKKNQRIFSTPSAKIANEKWPQHKRKYPRYYGWDKFQTKTQLLGFINRAQKEFFRILKDDGMLWFKWCEIKALTSAILPLFKNWVPMMEIHTTYYGHTGKSRTYWIMLMKDSEFRMKGE